MAHFHDAHMSFPLPSFLLELLAELEMTFTQITPNLWRYVLATYVRAREEGLEFGLAELKQLYTLKRSSGFPGTILLAPREELFGCANMTPELRELIAALRRGECDWSSFTPERIQASYAMLLGLNRAAPIPLAEPVRPQKDRKGKDTKPSKRARRTPDKRVLRSSSQAQSSIIVATPVSVVAPVHGDQPESQAPDEPGAGGETASGARRLCRRAMEEALSRELSTSSSGPPYAKRHPGEGNSWMAFSYDSDAQILENPEQLASIWRKIRTSKCELPSLDQMRGREAYVRMAVANARIRNGWQTSRVEKSSKPAYSDSAAEIHASQASEQQRVKEVEDLKVLLTASEAEKVALTGDLDSLKEKFRCEAEGREKAARKERQAACRLIVKGYDAALDNTRETLRRRKEESAAEIRLQEIRAKIEALTEYGEGGLELEAELARLKGMETSVEIDYGLAVVSDNSLRGLDLPQVSGDSVNQGRFGD
ncbi:uncharacterized protein LOC130511193 [Raphanus sativus]|uniref:Uncharacterized protein LOC130511193 n=1 Tax=Raphanus sativus TaxID=3726 RepID=A0A9W3DJI0_RAPSA|nr:uncharacterized protein LOC130511193 [Raphanus sativus]